MTDNIVSNVRQELPFWTCLHTDKSGHKDCRFRTKSKEKAQAHVKDTWHQMFSTWGAGTWLFIQDTKNPDRIMSEKPIQK